MQNFNEVVTTYGVSCGHAHGPGAGDQMTRLKEAEAVIKALLAVPDQFESFISNQSERESLLGEDVGAWREHNVDHPGHIGGAHLYRSVAKTHLEQQVQQTRTHLTNQRPSFRLLTNQRPLLCTDRQWDPGSLCLTLGADVRCPGKRGHGDGGGVQHRAVVAVSAVCDGWMRRSERLRGLPHQ